MFKQEVPKFNLSIEQDTSAVPGDGRYHVLLAGEVIHSAQSKSEALTYYKEKRDELARTLGKAGEEPPGREEVLSRLRTEGDVYAVRADAFRRREGLGNRKGGKGGRGGV